jgi:ribulose 1,5-bisphosphate carboxylase large subunit-like protein
MQVAKIIPSKLIRKVIEGKLNGKTSNRDFMVECISKIIKIFADPTRKKIFLECLDSPKEFDRNSKILYHLRILEDYGIIKYTSKGYAATKFGRELWESISKVGILPNSYLTMKILLSLSKPKRFIELKKELKINEGSLFRALNFLADNKLIMKKDGSYSLSPLIDLSKLNIMIQRYAELIKDMSYDASSESATFPKEKEIEILNLFETEEKKHAKKKIWREEDLIKDHVIISCSYTSPLEVDNIFNYILEEFCGSTNFARVKLLHSYEKNMIKLGYEEKYFTSLQKLLNLFHLHGWRAFDSLLIEDVKFPKKFIKKFKGPKFGRNGIRKLLGIKDRPILQAGLLPEEGFTIQSIKEPIKRLFLTGVDEASESFVTLDDLKTFRSRVETITQLIDDIKNECGQKIYYFYIYGDECEERLDILKEAESKCVGIMFSPITIGFPLASRIICNNNYPVQIHLTLLPPFIKYAKRRITKEGEVLPGFGISINVLLKLFILLGADEIPIESPFQGHYEWWETKVQLSILNNYFEELKTPFPVLFGGITPANTLTLIKNLHKDIVIKFRAWDLIKAERTGFSIERSINAFKQAIEIAMSGEKEITEEKYKDYIDSLKFYS